MNQSKIFQIRENLSVCGFEGIGGRSSFERYGFEAHLPYLSDMPVAFDERGYVATGDRCETAVEGIYAVGEVTNRMHPSCVTAMADGVTAAKAIQERLDSGVGAQFAAMAQRAWAGRHPSR